MTELFPVPCSLLMRRDIGSSFNLIDSMVLLSFGQAKGATFGMFRHAELVSASPGPQQVGFCSHNITKVNKIDLGAGVRWDRPRPFSRDGRKAP